MKCRLFRDLLDEYMDNELTDARRESMETHAHSCANCGELMQERKRLFHRLTDALEPDWNFSLADSVMLEIRALPLPQAANPLRKSIIFAIISALVISGIFMIIGLGSLPDSLSPVDLFKLMAGSVEMPPGMRASVNELGAFLTACWVIVRTMIQVVVQIATVILFKVPLTIPLVIVCAAAVLGIWKYRRKRRGSTMLGMLF